MKLIAERLLNSQLYQSKLQKLCSYEADRIYCRHDLAHFREVGRIAGVVARENKLVFSQDLIDTCALLHDMGRVEQFESGISHEKASVAFAREILLYLGCEEDYICTVCDAIAHHSRRYEIKKRYGDAKKLTELGEILSYGDHFSRKCYKCQAARKCKWPSSEKIDREYYGGTNENRK